MMKKKIAFIRPKAWPLANVKVADALREQFSNYDIEIIDIEDLVKTNASVLIINTLIVWMIYGWDIVTGYKKFKDAFWRSPFIYEKVSHLLKKQLSDQNYAFTFQMQSLFDCSLPNVPHFIYTDHTHRRVLIEYALIDGVNDTLALADELADLLHGMLCLVNLIALNPSQDGGLEGSSREQVEAFRDRLMKRGIQTTIRLKRGIEINAGCGQLATTQKDK